MSKLVSHLLAAPGASDISFARRASRRLLTPVSRQLARSRDSRALSRLFAEPAVDPRRLLLFVVSTPGQEQLALANVRRLVDHCRLRVVLNGYSRVQARRMARAFSPAATVRVSALPGFPVRHGTVLSLLLRAAREDFAVMDADCFVRDRSLLAPPCFEDDELMAAPDHAHFRNVNRVTGQRFPRTHFLIFNIKRMQEVMHRYSIDAEKVIRPPRRLTDALAEDGYGVHNYPRSHLRMFDTLVLLMAMAFHDGLKVRWLPVEFDQDQILHWKEQAARVRDLGARRRAAHSERASRGESPAARVGAAGQRAKPPESVLLCHAHLDRYSGSEIGALELAEAFRSVGARVSLMTRRLRNPIKKDLRAAGFEVFHPGSEPEPGAGFDLVINFHRNMHRWLERYRIDSRRRVFLSLSPLSRLCAPPAQPGPYDKVLAVSAETRTALSRYGVHQVAVVPNWAPDEMFSAFGPRSCKLERVLCVSNHPPPELRDLRRPLARLGPRLTFIGRRTGGPVRRVDAELLGSYDLVVTIGKTVQYALAAGLPVYCYDRWGGHGYIDPQTLDHAEETNFSGRCCGRRLTAEELAAGIHDGFRAAFAGRDELHEQARRRYRLATILERLF